MQTTSFLGRAVELVELERLLARPEVRLLTLWGPGGIGKTRLAIALAGRQRERFAGGVTFVPLQAVRSPEDVPAAVAAALGLPLTGAGDPLEQLLATLRQRERLLILDNVEQLGDGVVLFSRLLAEAPGLKLLATSREALQLQEEWLYSLAGLATNTTDSAPDSEALQLFFARARQSRHDLKLEAERAAAVTICRLVEGMPLALELAAAWTRTLSCLEIVVELQRDLNLLAGGPRNLPARHRSLWRVCDQSWALLGPAEQRAFARLAVFRAGFSAEAALAVAEADLTLLDALVRASLVRRGDHRYAIHELLRQYAMERLGEEASEAAAAAAAAGRFYGEFLQQLFTENARHGVSASAVDAVIAERDNIRASWRDILAQHDGEALRQVASIAQVAYFVRGPYQEGLRLIEQVVETLETRPKDLERQVALADARSSLGWFLLRQGHIDRARAQFAASAAEYGALAVPRPPGDSTDPLAGLSVVALVEGDYREAARLGRAVLTRAEAEGHSGNLTDGLYGLVSAAQAQGHYRAADRLARRLAAHVSAVGNRWFEAYCRVEQGHIALGLGRYSEARRHYTAAYALREEFADPQGMALAASGQGRAALMAGAADDARSHYERSLALYQGIGDPGGLVAVLDGLARALAAAGDRRAARERLLTALTAAAALPSVPLQLSVLVSAAELLQGTGELRAVALIAQLAARHPAADRDTSARAHLLVLGGQAQPEPLTLSAPQDEDVAAAIDASLAALAEASLLDSDRTGEPDIALTAGDLVEPLTARERDILSQIAAGRSNREIAEQLIVSVGTVKWYTTHIYGKLGVRSRTQALNRARELGLVG